MSQPELEYIACPNSGCGGQWLPVGKTRQLRESHKAFYCPAGHSQYFSGLTKQEQEIKNLRARVAELERCPLCNECFSFDRLHHLRKEHGAYNRKKRRKAA